MILEKTQSAEGMTPEERLLEQVWRARAGDTEAFALLYQYYSPAISKYVTGLAGPDAAPDLLQDTFYKAWFNLHVLTHADNFKSWLYTIATNVSRDYLRAKKGSQPVWEYLSENYLDGQATGFEDRVEERELVRLALMEVASKLRSCLLLQVEGFDRHAIAEVLGLNAQSVGTYVSMGRMQFRQAYDRIRRAAESDPPTLPSLQASSNPEQSDSSEPAQPLVTDVVGGGEGETEGALDERSEMPWEDTDALGWLALRIGKLPAPYRRTLYLKLVKHCSNREIAAQLQLPLGTVKSHISRGKDLLGAIMEPKAGPGAG